MVWTLVHGSADLISRRDSVRPATRSASVIFCGTLPSTTWCGDDPQVSTTSFASEGSVLQCEQASAMSATHDRSSAAPSSGLPSAPYAWPRFTAFPFVSPGDAECAPGFLVLWAQVLVRPDLFCVVRARGAIAQASVRKPPVAQVPCSEEARVAAALARAVRIDSHRSRTILACSALSFTPTE